MPADLNDIFLSNFSTKLSNFSKIDFEPEDVTERGCEEEEGKGMEGQRFLKPTMPVFVSPISRSQFHQPTGAMRKCSGTQHLAQKMPLSFTIKTAPSKFSVNLLVQNLFI